MSNKQKTLIMIKPDAVSRSLIGKIIAHFEANGLNPVAFKMTKLDKALAEGFYAEHKGKPFFESLVSYMTSGTIVIMVLEGENAVLKAREIMGVTDPATAKDGTIRKLYAISKQQNSVHGSDSLVSAEREIKYYFGSTI